MTGNDVIRELGVLWSAVDWFYSDKGDADWRVSVLERLHISVLVICIKRGR